jgi:hypothetical protein
MIALKLVRRPDGWWITNKPPGFDDSGPYESRQAAQAGCRGLVEFYRREKKLLAQLAAELSGRQAS